MKFIGRILILAAAVAVIAAQSPVCYGAGTEETLPRYTAGEELRETEPVTESTDPEGSAEDCYIPEQAGQWPEATDHAQEYEADSVVSNDLKFPLYFQTDYPDLRYGSGTIKSNGCSAVSLAMMANALTGFDYTPVELAEYFGGRAYNNIARLELGIEKLGLPAQKVQTWPEVWKALQEGKTAIVLVHSGCSFTVSQHFLVLKGLNDQGRIMVNDSREPNYKRWDLKDGFANGFEPWQIVRGWDGGWIFDPAQVAQDITRYWEPPIDPSQTRYPDIQLTQEEEELLAKVIWAEARGESLEGQQAVAEVVLNRMVSEKFGGSLRDVVYAADQFHGVSGSRFRQADPGQAQYQAIARALYGPNILPLSVLYFGTSPRNKNIWGSIGGHVFCHETE